MYEQRAPGAQRGRVLQQGRRPRDKPSIISQKRRSHQRSSITGILPPQGSPRQVSPCQSRCLSDSQAGQQSTGKPGPLCLMLGARFVHPGCEMPAVPC